MRNRSIALIVVSVLTTGLMASTASAQTTPDPKRLFAGITLAPVAKTTNPIAFTTATPAPRRQSARAWTPFVFGGIPFPGIGLAVGGGAMMSNLADREEFGLQIDGLLSTGGNCSGFCNTDGFSSSLVAIAGAFIYKFNETSGGWQPFAGGGPVFTRYSFSFDDDILNAFTCDNTDLCSVSNVGIQVQGGVSRGKLHLEARAQGTSNSAFLLLVGYKFGS